MLASSRSVPVDNRSPARRAEEEANRRVPGDEGRHGAAQFGGGVPDDPRAEVRQGETKIHATEDLNYFGAGGLTAAAGRAICASVTTG